MSYSVVLEDGVLKEWYAFKHGGEFNQGLVDGLLSLYKPTHLTNVEQLERVGVRDDVLSANLAASSFLSQSVEELVRFTDYKIILSNSSSDYPCVHVGGDVVENSYTLTFKPGESRNKAYDLIQGYLRDAEEVLFYDDYFAKDRNWEQSKQIFSLFPLDKNVKITFSTAISEGKRAEVSDLCDLWEIIRDSDTIYRDHHDRYLLIDDRVEIIITSGIDHLFRTEKECSLIIRLVSL